MKRAIFKTMMCAAVSGTLFALSSCNDAEDLYNPAAAEQRYDNAYQTVVGEDVDPYQTWNTAIKATVKINMPFISGADQVRVYNKNFLLDDCVLYGSGTIQEGCGNLSVDLPLDAKTVFVTIEDSEEIFKVYNSFNITNGMVYVEQGNEATTRANTRTIHIEKGTEITRSIYYDTGQIGWRYEHDGNKKTYSEWQDYYDDLYEKGNLNDDSYGPYIVSSISDWVTEQVGWTYQKDQWHSYSKTYEEWKTYYQNLYSEGKVSISNNDGPYELTSIFTTAELTPKGIQWGNDMKTVDEWIAYYNEFIAGGGKLQYNNPGPFEWGQVRIGWVYNYNWKTDAQWAAEYQWITESNDWGPYVFSTVTKNEDGTFNFDNAVLKDGVEPWYSDSEYIIYDSELREGAAIAYDEHYEGLNFDNPQTRESGVSEYITSHYSKPNCLASTAQTKNDGKVSAIYGVGQIKYTLLDKDEIEADTSTSEPWKLGWGYDMFGPGSFFAGGIAYDDGAKTSLTGYNVNKIKAGVTLTTTGGEIRMPLIFGATSYNPKLGYVYYKEDASNPLKPLSEPHYVFISDGEPEHNLKFENGDVVTDNQLDGWKDTEKALNSRDCTFEDVVYGTVYRPVFFGENHDYAEGTYNFPSGYKIVFFVDNIDDRGTTSVYNYSVPALNYPIRASETPQNYDHRTEDETEGAVKAAAWSYNGHTYVGFEDDTDNDLNDMVFWLEGACSLDVAPITVPVKTEEKTASSQSWILACEDLGGQFDFDFNDVVLKVTYASGDSTATVTPLAAGGSLPVYVLYKNQLICEGDSVNSEIHHLLGGTATDALINTETSRHEKDPASPIIISISSDFSMADKMGDFSILVIGQRGWSSGRSIAAPSQGASPQMICIDGSTDWAWPTERVCITDAYPQFGEWGANMYSNTDWYKYPDRKQVVDAHGNTVWSILED